MEFEKSVLAEVVSPAHFGSPEVLGFPDSEKPTLPSFFREPYFQSVERCAAWVGTLLRHLQRSISVAPLVE